MTTIYLIRHAEAEGNIYRRIHGWYDAQVTGNGLAQIEALAGRFRDVQVDAVYSSDLCRTMTTAQAVCRPKGLPLRTDPDLREIHMGELEDRPWGEWNHSAPREMARFTGQDPTWKAPGGESFREVGDRMTGALLRIARRHPGQTVAVFSHGAAIRQTLSQIKGFPPERWSETPHGENTSVSKLIFDGERLSVEYEVDASHLDSSICTLSRQNWWRRDGSGPRDVGLWYRPAGQPGDRDLYLEARRDAWLTTHGVSAFFDGESFLRAAEVHLSSTDQGVLFAMSEDTLVGVLELDPVRYRENNAGYVPFCYIRPQFRQKNMGVQLIGQAVSFFRPLGRRCLRLRCAPYNWRAQRFYAKYGFAKIGEESKSRVPLDILEKNISYAPPLVWAQEH